MELFIPSTTAAAGNANVERLAGLSFDPYNTEASIALGRKHRIMKQTKSKTKILPGLDVQGL